MNKATAPFISIVIPTYNHAHFLGYALQSVLNQTYTNWEVIVIDNHSQDNTDEVVQQFSDRRIILHKIHNHGVIAISRNTGILAAKGEWVAFLDSDDLWYPQKLEITVIEIQKNASIDVFSTDEVMVDEMSNRKRLLKYGPYCQNFYRTLLIEGNRLSPSATLVRLDFLKKHKILFRESDEFVTAEDYDFWMLLAQAGASFKFIRSVQGEYRIHAINNSNQIDRHSQAVSNVARNHTFKLQTFQYDVNKLWRKINARLMLAQAKAQFGQNKFVPGFRSLSFAFLSSFSGSLWFILSRASKSFINLFKVLD
jgi:glycosyltransferase involved in cell wall biosynthesis